MRKRFIILVLLALFAFGGTVAPFTTLFMRTVLDDETAAEARTTLEIQSEQFAPLLLAELSADPPKPAEGKMKLWMSDGTQTGDDGDLMIGATAGGTTKRAILWDFSAATEWVDDLLLETADALLLETADRLLLE